MKIELLKENAEMLKVVMHDLGIVDNANNRQQTANSLISSGATMLLFYKGVFQGINYAHGIDAILDPEEKEEEPESVPIQCPDCGKPVIWNGCAYVCNCRWWPGSPNKVKK